MWPTKTSELETRILDSRRWNGFHYRPDDVVVATWGKSGTTWVLQIVSQIVFRGEEQSVADLVSGPHWVEWRGVPEERAHQVLESQTHRRFLKTHLPLDALVFSPLAKYIYIGRDPRDSVWSWHNHLASLTDAGLARQNAVAPGVGCPRVRPRADARRFYNDFLDGDPDAGPGWPLWSNVRSWWEGRSLPNVLLVHYASLKADLRGSIRAIAAFLETDLDEDTLNRILDHCSFEYMRRSAIDSPGQLDEVWEEGGASFFNRGENAPWRDVLTPEEAARCGAVAAQHLTPECAQWLQTGERLDL